MKRKLVTIRQPTPTFEIWVFVLLVSTLLASAFSLATTSYPIQSSGKINVMSPLHVDGKYIKDSDGDIIYLRGVGKIHWDDDPTGWWWPEGGAWSQNYLTWDENAVRYHLRQMKSFGMNVVRFHTIAEWWIQDTVTVGSYTGSYRNNLKRTFQIAQEERMYVIMDLFAVKSGTWMYANGYGPPSIPFPPYLNYPEETAIFSNKQSFVDYWANVASELKSYDNVIFELYNEPNSFDLNGQTMEVARADWFDGMQKAIDAIRAVGAQNLIIVMWELGVIPALPYTYMDWIAQASLNDTTGNLAYSGHLYRTYYNPSWYDAYNYTSCYSKMEQCKFKYVLDSLSKPVIISEIGINMWSDNSITDSSGLTELQKELQWARNVFRICNQWGIGYVAWDWTITDTWHLISLSGLPKPSEWGQVLIDAIADGGTIASP